MTQSKPQRTYAKLMWISLLVGFGLTSLQGPRQLARADDSMTHAQLSLQLQLEGGAGTHASRLPGTNGTRRLDTSWFPVAGFRISASQATSERLRFGAELTYLSSTAFEISRAVAPNAVELSDARAQEVHVLGRVALALNRQPHPVVLPFSLGYSFDAFTTATPLTAAQAYLLSGPRVAVGIEVPLWAGRLSLSGRAELGANLTESAALREAGVSSLGVHYAFQAAADVQLTRMLSLGVRFRQADVQLPLSGEGSFHEQRRFVLAYLSLRNAP